MNQTTDYNKYIDHLISVMDSVEPNKLTVLTGRNGSGKSMIRKLIRQFLEPKFQQEGKKFHLASTSMDDRAGVDPNRMMVFSRDCEWLPTGENTIDSVESVLKSEECFMILDEIELGMGEELQMGLAQYINEMKATALEKGLGILIITHSRTIVSRVDNDKFINLEGLSEEEWLNREVVPESPSDFKERSRQLSIAFEKRLQKK